MKHHSTPHKDIGEGSRRYGGNQQGDQVGHGQVQHQHLKRKHQPGNRGFEDSRNGPCSPASDHQDDIFVVHPEKPCEVGTNGRPGKYDGGFRAHRTSKPDGYAAGDHRRPCIVPFQTAVLARNGIQNLADTVVDIVFYHVFHKKIGDGDTDEGVSQEKNVEGIDREHVGEEKLHEVNEFLEHQGGDSAHDPNKQTQEIDKAAFADV